MRAVVFERFGGPEVLHLGEVPEPDAGPGQVRVRVEAVGVNPFDGKVRSGAMESMFRTELPGVPGAEVAGVVDQVGPGVTGVGLGDRVAGHAGRGAAEYAVLRSWAAVPDGMDATQAAALPVVTETARRALRILDPKPGETLLVHGASGGVGGLATQLAAAAGVTVIGTASPSNHDRVASFGATPTSYGPGLVERVRAVTPTVDAVLDAAGRGALPDSIELRGGTDRVLTLADPAAAELGVRFTDGGKPSAADLAELLGLVARGEVSVPVAKVLPFAQAAEAQSLVDGGHAGGKVVLVP
ncbi:NADP-dependent oxidoreductase [Myceligenerans pegani]|uniref:NADP-dependent oxidoreductase n=1 Tax=Myceligenerans pegani TaxID=2776917 RepID=A0ABR9N3U8_9MICO|nr:NADP-dependent oxidoreductase [Myceligenerans sp. TRM 65318]MBE1878340.1 NADP-dependent oxidoreductase [Myceligenerans sp. TRM 65318]MBE3020611.1 NADP-dependent oxidoreductase [Myceligenerans sp. TRM 65318]